MTLCAVDDWLSLNSESEYKIRGINFVPDSAPPAPPPLWPGEATQSDDLTLVFGFPAHPMRPVIKPVFDSRGRVSSLRLVARAAAKVFAREYLVRFAGRLGKKPLFERALLRELVDEMGDVFGVEISEFEPIEEQRVLDLVEGFLLGFESGYQAAGLLLSGRPDNIAILAEELPRLPWGCETGNPDADLNPLEQFCAEWLISSFDFAGPKREDSYFIPT